MNRSSPSKGQLVLVVVLCVTASGVGVQLADPFAPTVAHPAGDPPTDPEAEPAEALHYALGQLNTTSYTLTVRLDRSGDRTRFWYSEVNYSERRVYFEVGPVSNNRSFYVYADGAWTRGPDRTWRHYGLFDRENRFQRSTTPAPFRPGTITAERTTVLNRTTDALWLRVSGDRQVAIPREVESAYVRYELDPESLRVRRAVAHDANGDVRAVYVFEDYEETSVDRPPGTRNFPVNLLSDLLR